MARPLRIEYEGAFYHVTARGNERGRIYFEEADYEKFKIYLKEAEEKYNYLLHCYLLMTNHYHLLIETKEANLSNVMHYINGSYTNYINIKRRRSGHLFQGRYNAILIEQDSYLLQLSRYIHLNPVKAKIVERPEDYPYSSYNAYIYKLKEDIVDTDLIIGMISKTKEDAIYKYKDFVNSAVSTEIENPLKNVYAGIILGRTKFVKEALNRIKKEDLNRKDISHKRALKAEYRPKEIMANIYIHFDISSDELPKSKDKIYRDIAIYLLKKYTGLTNRQIGEFLGNLSHSAVIKAHQRFSEKLKRDKMLKKEIYEIMSNVGG